jgi:hypothetical protein
MSPSTSVPRTVQMRTYYCVSMATVVTRTLHNVTLCTFIFCLVTTRKEYFHCAVRTESINTIQVNSKSLQILQEAFDVERPLHRQLRQEASVSVSRSEDTEFTSGPWNHLSYRAVIGIPRASCVSPRIVSQTGLHLPHTSAACDRLIARRCVIWVAIRKFLQTRAKNFRTVKADLHVPCRSPATTLPFSDSAVSYVKLPYLVHEVLLLSPSRNYLLLNCYHNLCAVNYTITHVLVPK